MKPIRIDFAAPGLRRTLYRTPLAHWLLVVVGLAMCVGAALGIARMLERQRAREALIAQAYSGRAAPPSSAKRSPIPEARANAINGFVQQLNLPWRDLQEAIETATPPNVALLALDPDAKTRNLRITAEAKTSDDMLSYVQSIKEQPFFVSAGLVKHELNDQDPNHPLRFQLDAQWAERGVAP